MTICWVVLIQARPPRAQYWCLLSPCYWGCSGRSLMNRDVVSLHYLIADTCMISSTVHFVLPSVGRDLHLPSSLLCVMPLVRGCIGLHKGTFEMPTRDLHFLPMLHLWSTELHSFYFYFWTLASLVFFLAALLVGGAPTTCVDPRMRAYCLCISLPVWLEWWPDIFFKHGLKMRLLICWLSSHHWDSRIIWI